MQICKTTTRGLGPLQITTRHPFGGWVLSRVPSTAKRCDADGLAESDVMDDESQAAAVSLGETRDISRLLGARHSDSQLSGATPDDGCVLPQDRRTRRTPLRSIGFPLKRQEVTRQVGKEVWQQVETTCTRCVRYSVV